jgi:Protein of unknown function (DUF3147)
MTEPLEPDPGEPLMGWDLAKLREVRLGDIEVRFAFGAAVSILAAVIGSVFGDAAGGMFLAFPAILPAALTMLEQKDGPQEALHDQRGALLGALGMVAFAVAAALGFSRWPSGLVLVAAAAAWSATSVTIYLLVASWRRAHRPRHLTRAVGPTSAR